MVTNGIVSRCQCDLYHRNVETRTTTAYPGAPCDIIYEVETDIGYSEITMTIQNPTHFPKVDYYLIKAHRTGSATEMLPVNPVHNTRLTGGAAAVFLSNLDPGRRYTVEFEGYDTSGSEVYTNIRKMVGIAVTHCGCSDTDYAKRTNGEQILDSGNAENSTTFTGTPRDFSVYQEQGYVLFEFVDDSRCEEAFAFTRDSDSFVPNYIYASVDPCSKATIKPGLAAADNLQKSRLQVFQNYTYCVSAVGRE